MNLQHFTSQIPDSVSQALADFEKDFTYPLGTSCRFRISHGDDYLRFFRSMGKADLLVVGTDERVMGGIARAEKRLSIFPKTTSASQMQVAHYLCDLKVRTEARGSMALPRLIRETKRQIEASGTRACFSVVMDGTGRLPTDYTGRLGVPKFGRLAGITILRLSESGVGMKPCSSRVVDPTVFAAISAHIHHPGFRAGGGNRRLRSLMEPVCLASLSGDACGILEDTRRAKRLILETGEELLSAHFSGFHYRSPEAGGLLLQDAVAFARTEGISAVFTAVPSAKWPLLQPHLASLDVTEAPATIYGNELDSGLDWWIDTAEI
jgi:hypothetical protein